MLFVLTGLSACTEEEPPLIKEENTTATTDKEESKAEEEKPLTNEEEKPATIEEEKPVADIDPIIYNPDLNPDYTWGSVSDIDGNTYKTVQIGTQTWMAENLRTTKFNDGNNMTTGAYYWYNNDPVSFKNTYGALYDWYAVNTGKLCPTGWHVPGDEEWKQLEMALGMSRASADTSYVDFDVYGMGYRGTDQGTQMKATNGWIPWEGRGGNGTNTSGFSALPAGDTGWDYKFGGAGVCTSFWCFGEPPIARTLGTDESKVSRAVYYKYIGFSVRCLKD
jgi:uncharacterized protein (TIGR02145 family)